MGASKRMGSLIQSPLDHCRNQLPPVANIPMDAFRKIFPGEYYKKFLAHGVRPDDRSLLSIRNTTISLGGTTSAYGSAFVKVGNTTILCGIRAEVGFVPLPTDRMNAFDRRHIVVNLDMLPLCSPNIRSGKPTERAQTIGQSLNDLCHNLLDPTNLYSESDPSYTNNKVVSWYLYADMYCFDHDGNVEDCAVLALVSALKSTLLPRITVTPAGEATVSSEMTDRTIALQLTHMPILTTFGIIDQEILADPNLEEESILTGTLSITYDERGNLCSLQCIGGSSISDEQTNECMRLAKARVISVTNYINSSVSAYFDKLGRIFAAK